MSNFILYLFVALCIFAEHCLGLINVKVDNTVSNLPFEKSGALFFTSKPYNSKIYGFQTNLVNKAQKIDIFTFSSNEQKWSKSNNSISCPDSNIPCIVHNVFITVEKLYVIFKSDKKIYITSTDKDGLKWTDVIDTKIIDNENKALYYSGQAFEFPGSLATNESSLFICIEKKFETNTQKITQGIAECLISHDKGNTWTENTRISVNEKFSDYTIKSIFYFSGAMHLRLLDPKTNISEVFICDKKDWTQDIICSIQEFNGTSDYKLEEINMINGYLVSIWEKEKEQYFSVSYDGVSFSNFTKIPKGESYSFAFLNNNLGGLFIHKSNSISMYMLENVNNRKVGCEDITGDNKENLKLTHKFIKNDKGEFECYLNAMESSLDEKEINKYFYVITDTSITFPETCFVNLYVTAFEDQLIKPITKKSLSKLQGSTNQQQYEFFYPQKYENFFYNGSMISCDSSQKNYKIHFTFNTLVNGHIFSEVTVKNNEQVSIDANDILIFDKCLDKEDNTNFKLPSGSIVLADTTDVQTFQISNKIKDKEIIEINTHCRDNPKRKINITFNKGMISSRLPMYQGVDLTNSSTNYTLVKEKVDADEIINIYVSDFTDDKILGLACPYSKDSDNMFCFENIYDENYVSQKISVLFPNSPYFIFPKRKLYNPKEAVAESLFYLNTDMVSELKNSGKIVTMRCFCFVNAHEIQVKFLIAPNMKEEALKDLNEKNIEDKKSIMSSEHLQYMKNKENKINGEEKLLENAEKLKHIEEITPLLDYEAKIKELRKMEPEIKETPEEDKKRINKVFTEGILQNINNIFQAYQVQLQKKSKFVDQKETVIYGAFDKEFKTFSSNSRSALEMKPQIRTIKKYAEEAEALEVMTQSMFDNYRNNIIETKKNSEEFNVIMKKVEEIESADLLEAKKKIEQMILKKMIESLKKVNENILLTKNQLNKKFEDIEKCEIARADGFNSIRGDQKKKFEDAKAAMDEYTNLEASRKEELTKLKEKSMILANKFVFRDVMQKKYLNMLVLNEHAFLKKLIKNDNDQKEELKSMEVIVKETNGKYDEGIRNVDYEIISFKQLEHALYKLYKEKLNKETLKFHLVHTKLSNASKYKLELYNTKVGDANTNLGKFWNRADAAISELKKSLTNEERKIVEESLNKENNNLKNNIKKSFRNAEEEPSIKNDESTVSLFTPLKVDEKLKASVMNAITIMEPFFKEKETNEQNVEKENEKGKDNNVVTGDQSTKTKKNESGKSNHSSMCTLNSIFITIFIYVFVYINI